MDKGSVFGFLGPNGAGKTTTLRILTGLAEASAGQAFIDGISVADHQKVSRLIGYLPEEPAFYRWMTPVELLDHVGRVFGQPAADRHKQARQLLELVGLTEVAKRRIGGFSRGMRQRLGLAQALMNDPQVLLLDEPVSALDPQGRKEVLEMIAALKDTATIFMSTHILADVERICDQVGIIDHGRLVIEGKRADLLARYHTDTILIEFEPGHEGVLSTWLKGLKADWLVHLSTEGGTARIQVKDIALARKELLGSLGRSKLPLLKFEVSTPALEDVFLELVAANGGVK
ncbi:MAG: ABC transporter ATP-binding protein [Anaerolineaceae bacterium]|nr:ABC transporter ATP-binding protein [Anaerolineaceae bacterium]